MDIYGEVSEDNIEALYITDKIRIDGILNEPVWEEAVPISDLLKEN